MADVDTSPYGIDTRMYAAGYRKERTGGDCMAWSRLADDESGDTILITNRGLSLYGAPSDLVWVVGRENDLCTVQVGDVTLTGAMALATVLPGPGVAESEILEARPLLLEVFARQARQGSAHEAFHSVMGHEYNPNDEDDAAFWRDGLAQRGRLRCPNGHTADIRLIEDTTLTHRVLDMRDGVLAVSADAAVDDETATNARLFCVSCAQEFPLPDGVDIEWRY